MNTESRPNSAVAQRLERVGGAIGQCELTGELRCLNRPSIFEVDATSGFE